MAIGPIDYTIGQVQPDYLKDVQAGIQLGQGIRQLYQSRNTAEDYQRDIAAAMAAPTPQNFASLALKYPTQREAIKQAFNGLSEADKKDQQNYGTQAYSALLSGSPDIAKNITERRIEARKNSGLDTTHEESILSALNNDPRQAQAALGFTLSQVSDPEKFAGLFSSLQSNAREDMLSPSKVREASANANKAESDAGLSATRAAVASKYADSQALADLEKTGWDVKKLQADIVSQREQNRIAAMNAALNREGNDLKREELRLKLEDAKSARDEKVRARAAEANAAASAVDNMLNTVDRILSNKSLNNVVGSIEGRVGAYLSDEAADAIAQIDTLGSQVFLSQIPAMKGTGSLTEKEGEKLQSSLQNLSRVQSESQFKANLNEIKRLGIKARKGIESKYGIPLAAPDTPAATPPSTGNAQRKIVVDY